MTKKLLLGLGSAVLVMMLVFAGSNISGNQVSVADTEMTGDVTNHVIVSGTGEIEVTPDIATINIGVETQNANANTAQKENATKMDALVKAIKAKGIDEKDIQTVQYNLYRQSNYVDGEVKDYYYVASNTVNITVRDIDKVGLILDAASTNGANNINSISFSVSDDSEYYQEALKLAMANAKEKANAIMSTFGEVADKPVSVTEVSSGGAVVYTESAVRSYAMDAVSTPISAGELTISATVNVTYGY